MSDFKYVAVDSNGKKTHGRIQAGSEHAVAEQLRNQGLLPIKISPAHSFRQRGKKISHQDRELFTRQCASLLKAGVPLSEAVQTIAQQSDKPSVKKILTEIHNQLNQGVSLSLALTQSEGQFSKAFCASVAAGEQTGKLDLVLAQLADQLAAQQTVRDKVRQALLYPTMMTIVAFSIVAFLLTYVVPKIIAVFDREGQTLPFVTRILLGISRHLQSFYWLYLLIIVLGVVGLKFALRNQDIRRTIQARIVGLPLIGRLLKLNFTTQYYHSLALLMSAGVDILNAMRIASELISWLPLRDALDEAREKVREGAGLAQALSDTDYFTPLTLHLVASGESSGHLDTMLAHAADNQAQELTRTIDTGLSLFEPCLILLMGGIILFIVLAILLPVFSYDQLI